MSVRTQPLTYEDIPTPPPDSGERYELIGGELIVTASPAPVHQRLVLRLVRDVDEAVVRPGTVSCS